MNYKVALNRIWTVEDVRNKAEAIKEIRNATGLRFDEKDLKVRKMRGMI